MSKERPAPLSVRLSEAEKMTLAETARQLNTSRNQLMRTAALTLLRELRETQMVRA